MTKRAMWSAAAVIAAAVLFGPGDVAAQVSSAPVTIALAAPGTTPSVQWNDGRFHTPVVRVGQDFTLQAGETAREVRGVLGDVTLEGHVERDALVILGDARVKAGSVVDGALVVIGGGATVEPGAQVGRELIVIGGALQAPAGFAPGGDLVAIGTPGTGYAVQALVPWLTRGLLWGRLIVPDLRWIWVVVAGFLLVYLVVNFLFNRAVAASAAAILDRPVSVFLLGLLVVILTVPAFAILAATVIGLAVVPFLLCALIVAGLIGKAGVARAIGYSLLGERLRASGFGGFLAFLVGAAILVLAYMVPVLGLITWAFTSVLAVGAAAAMLRRRLRTEGWGRQRAAARATEAGAWRSSAVPDAEAMPAPAEDITASSASFPLEAAEEGVAAPGAVNGASPTPGAAAPLRPGIFPPATFLDRVAAFALDCLLVALAVQLLDLARYNGTFAVLVVAYHIAFWTWKGTTLGGVVVGLRVTRVNGRALSFADALVRGLSGIFSIAALGIGCFWMLQDPARQMWHDKIAGTQVLKVPRELALQGME